MEALIIVWLMCSVIAGVIYRNKGRSMYWGCLVGLMLGLLGVLYAAVRSPVQSGLDKRAAESGYMKQCPYCHEYIRADAIVCRYCGRDV